MINVEKYLLESGGFILDQLDNRKATCNSAVINQLQCEYLAV
jgi:hypothetical protein